MEEPAFVRPPDFEWSPTIGDFAAALACAQGKIENAPKTAVNPFFKSRYADLAEVISAIREPLADVGIARHQAVFGWGGWVGVRTTLIHASGEWMASTVWCPFDGGPQDLGKLVTYLRRYSLSAAVGIAQEDDDANAAQGIAPPAPAPPLEAVKLDPKVQARIKILQAKLAIPDDEWREKLFQYYGVRSSSLLSDSAARDLVSRLEARVGNITQQEPVSPKSV